MKLSQIINENSIIPELKARDKKASLEELAGAIASQEKRWRCNTAWKAERNHPPCNLVWKEQRWA